MLAGFSIEWSTILCVLVSIGLVLSMDGFLFFFSLLLSTSYHAIPPLSHPLIYYRTNGPRSLLPPYTMHLLRTPSAQDVGGDTPFDLFSPCAVFAAMNERPVAEAERRDRTWDVDLPVHEIKFVLCRSTVPVNAAYHVTTQR